LKWHSFEEETRKLSQMNVGRQTSITSICIVVASEITGFSLVQFFILQYVWKFPVSKSNVIIILQKLLDSVKLFTR